MAKFGHSTTVTVNVWERIGEKHLAPSYIAPGRGGVSMIFQTHYDELTSNISYQKTFEAQCIF